LEISRLRENRLGKTRVLLAVRSLALQRVIEHLLKSRPELEILIGTCEANMLAQELRRWLPHVVVASSRICGLAARDTAALVRNSGPGVKLIVICSVDGFDRDVRKCGADACLAEEVIVQRLMPTVSQVVRFAQLKRPELTGSS